MYIGNWQFSPGKLTIENTVNGYEVDLERLTDPAQALDFVFQIAEKGQNVQADYDLSNFVRLLAKATNHHFGDMAQGVFCPSGEPRLVNWKTRESLPAGFHHVGEVTEQVMRNLAAARGRNE